MPIAQSKRKLIAATALFIAVGSLTGAIATGGAATISYAQQGGAQGGAQDGQQGGRIIREGTVTSSPNPLPGMEDQQRATILPLRQDGSIYTGVLTYTATEPVDVVVLNTQNLNETERAILNGTDSDLGTLLESRLNNQTFLVIATITPTYGGDAPPSASIPFAGNAVWLHTSDGTPFAAHYAVSAQILPAQTMNSISNVTAAATAAGGDGGDGDGGGAEGAASATAATTEEGGDGGGAEGAANATATDAGDADGA
ncbi:MAG: hypothetical protein ACJ70V_05320 [Nitrososphaera sp.]